MSIFKTIVRTNVMRKGGSSPFWAVVGTLSVLNTLRKKVGGRKRTSILSDGIRPGEVIEIRHSGAATKKVTKERAKKAALLAQLRVSDPRALGKAGRQSRKLHKRMAGSLIAEMASQSAKSSTSSPVTQLLDAAASALGAQKKPLTRHARKQAVKVAGKQAKKLNKVAAKQARKRSA